MQEMKPQLSTLTAGRNARCTHVDAGRKYTLATIPDVGQRARSEQGEQAFGHRPCFVAAHY